MSTLQDLSPVLWALILTLLIGVSYTLAIVVYNLFFHPLRNYPGPKLWAVTRIPYTLMFISGQSHSRVLELHRKYGDVVRLAPDTVSYNHPDAWKELHGRRKHGEHDKDAIFFRHLRKGIAGSSNKDHTRFRRALAPGFSAQAMQQQQPIIKGFVDLLLRRLHENCNDGARPLDMRRWFNYTTFDVIGDLAFGESFECLDKSEYHPWISLVIGFIKNMAFAIQMRYYPAIETVLMLMIPKELKRKRTEHVRLTEQKVSKRLAMTTTRPDFMDSLSRKGGSQELAFEEICQTASTLIIAGSETTATALTAATFFLTSNPPVLAKLAQEVRSTFRSESEIDWLSVQELPYMLAVLDETMRLCPPVPTGSPRIISKGGDVINGTYIPEGFTAQIWHWAVYHDPKNFALPDQFIPERWLDDPRFAKDNKDAFQPFSMGSRNCIGRNMAYTEMRLIMANLVWKFDLSIAADSKTWLGDSETFIVWEKPALNVYLKPRKLD